MYFGFECGPGWFDLILELSVAIEAVILGIDVVLVELPGKINESPLLDTEFLESVPGYGTVSLLEL